MKTTLIKEANIKSLPSNPWPSRNHKIAIKIEKNKESVASFLYYLERNKIFFLGSKEFNREDYFLRIYNDNLEGYLFFIEKSYHGNQWLTQSAGNGIKIKEIVNINVSNEDFNQFFG